MTIKEKEPDMMPELEVGVMPESVIESQNRLISLKDKVLILLKKGSFGKVEISRRLGQKRISSRLNKIIRDLLNEREIERTLPQKPQSRLQKYRLKQ